jgi:hypothetical protein
MRLLVFLVLIFCFQVAQASECEYLYRSRKNTDKWNEKCADEELKKGVSYRYLKMKEFYADMQEAIKNDDSKTLATMVRYPFKISFIKKDLGPDYGKEIMINNEEEFIKKYPILFNNEFKKFILNERYQDLHMSNLTASMTAVGLRKKLSVNLRCENPKSAKHISCTYYNIKIHRIDTETAIFNQLNKK